MKTSHLTPRSMRTRGTKSITWARILPPPETQRAFDGVIYRLARRDLGGAINVEIRKFSPNATRAEIARAVWAARRRLRDAVDARDLVHLGLVETDKQTAAEQAALERV